MWWGRILGSTSTRKINHVKVSVNSQGAGLSCGMSLRVGGGHLCLA